MKITALPATVLAVVSTLAVVSASGTSNDNELRNSLMDVCHKNPGHTYCFEHLKKQPGIVQKTKAEGRVNHDGSSKYTEYTHRTVSGTKPVRSAYGSHQNRNNNRHHVDTNHNSKYLQLTVPEITFHGQAQYCRGEGVTSCNIELRPKSMGALISKKFFGLYDESKRMEIAVVKESHQPLVIKVVGFHEGPENQVTLTEKAFEELAPTELGVVNVNWWIL
ncbi:hypothetical protein IWQ60_005294 [Tieghemiomyces parasiticus]|uniref:Uncharacterized protein n=1 Tax=Tieghemiomyces parasiticus TaxID=78921 RepID=A0A9W8AEA8_9FUNG|nr:hypothetical protein IWQ60_005294 [Tieghemiomyces parasiticus]